jgi:polyisoprenoid-binding protein YceI
MRNRVLSAILIATGVPCIAQLAAQTTPGDSIVYAVSPASRIEVRTGSSGLLSFAGHDHRIRARACSGRIVYRPGQPAASRVALLVQAESLEVLTPPDTAEIRKVTAVMRTEVLDVARHPEIRFASTGVAARPQGYEIRGNLTIRGTTRSVVVDVRASVSADTLTATGALAIKQTDFGIHPVRAGPMGVVKVADRIVLDFDIVAIRATPDQ